MADARVRIVLYKVGAVTTPPMSLENLEESLATIEKASPQPPELYFHVMRMFIEKMPGMIDKTIPMDAHFIVALWYRVLSHPLSGAETRSMVRNFLRNKDRDIRITWWIRDSDSPDFIIIGETFFTKIPNFDQPFPHGSYEHDRGTIH